MKILVVSDIHANPEAFEAVLESEAGGYEGFLCLGDITGYGPDGEPCIKILRSLIGVVEPCYILSGNHDAALSGKIPLSWFNSRAQASVLYTLKNLSPESLEWLSVLPSSRHIGSSVLAVHGSPDEPLTGYLLGGEETRQALSSLVSSSFELCFCGHTHETAVFSPGLKKRALHPIPGEIVPLKAEASASSVFIVNPGSVGFPRSFNGPPGIAASYPAYFAVWDTALETVTFLEARYDRRPFEKRIRKM